MKYIDTYWEKRNLGVNSCQIVVDKDDKASEVINAINTNCKDKDYIEVISDVGRTDVIWKLEDVGFRFIESIVEISLRRKEIIIPRHYLRFQDLIEYVQSTEDEIKIIKSNIETGTLFVTDKISLNRHFGKEQSGKRYSLWMDDLLSKSAKCFSVKYNGQLIGFEVVDCTDNVLELCIGGLIGNINLPGGGIFISIGRAKYIKETNIQRIKTVVSSNNPTVLRLHEETGFKVDKINYLLVRNKV